MLSIAPHSQEQDPNQKNQTFDVLFILVEKKIDGNF